MDGRRITRTFSPVLNMLNVRYLIWARDLPSDTKAVIRSGGYTVVENERALPRAFVPQTVQLAANDEELVGRLRDVAFDARRVSYITEPVTLPTESHGVAKIVEESSEKVIVDAQMDTPGMVVLGDLWDNGWRASVDGTPTKILAVNHTIRGVVVPAGQHRVVFRYLPESFRIGLIVSCAAVAGTFGWLTCLLVLRRKEQTA